jgi:hypothetical protein
MILLHNYFMIAKKENATVGSLCTSTFYVCSTVKYGAKPPPANITCVPYTLGKYTFINSRVNYFRFRSYESRSTLSGWYIFCWLCGNHISIHLF